jgi:hypothetical protein
MQALSGIARGKIGFEIQSVPLPDITDFFAVSRWERDPREVNLKREIDQTVEFFAYLRQRFPKSKIVWKQGNHEERWEHYLWRKAPELLSVDSFDVAEIFKLNQFGIELVRDKRIIMAGKLPVLHGHEFPKGLTNPVNQARGMFLRGLECAIAGHGHRSSEHAEASLLGKADYMLEHRLLVQPQS